MVYLVLGIQTGILVTRNHAGLTQIKPTVLQLRIVYGVPTVTIVMRKAVGIYTINLLVRA